MYQTEMGLGLSLSNPSAEEPVLSNVVRYERFFYVKRNLRLLIPVAVPVTTRTTRVHPDIPLLHLFFKINGSQYLKDYDFNSKLSNKEVMIIDHVARYSLRCQCSTLIEVLTFLTQD